MADFLSRCGQQERALAAYDRALELRPDHPQYLFNRAAVKRYVGELESAEGDYDRVIHLNRRDAEAWLNRSELRQQTLERNHLEALEERFREGFDSPADEVSLRYALAKELEDVGRYQESWDHLVAGAALRRRHLQYDVRQDVATVEWIIEAFANRLPAVAGFRSREPIFIVGMPRTGTTLLERILAGSPEVCAAGELNDFAVALVAAVQKKLGRAPVARRELVSASAAVDFERLGADYLERTRPRTGTRPRFTDKMPLNYLYCGLIQRALPEARIVHLTRQPLATCYAVFKTLFNRGYPFSYDLRELADYYIAYRRLMDHWHRSYPGVILDVSYEELVTEPQSQARRVFEFCGLDWQAAALEIDARTASTTTASAAQVRRPIYVSSVDLWKHYEPGLRPVAQRLRAAGIVPADL
ncbi:MAG: sulfotransferase [Proteobacteria bacterium]|nr:sulfotransferase [Pseudomonadota bacterium]